MPKMWAYMCSVVLDSFATWWTVAWQTSLSMEFSRQEYWSGLPCPPPTDLSDPGIKPVSPALAGGFFTIVLPGKQCPRYILQKVQKCKNNIQYKLSLSHSQSHKILPVDCFMPCHCFRLFTAVYFLMFFVYHLSLVLFLSLLFLSSFFVWILCWFSLLVPWWVFIVE